MASKAIVVVLALGLGSLFTLGTLGTLGTPAFAAEGAHPKLQAPDFGVEMKTTPKGELEIRALAPAEHHFNLQAPTYFKWLGAGGSSSTRVAPLTKTPRRLGFKVAQQNSARPYEISAYLCDDKDTYCERHDVQKTAPASVASKDGASPEQPKVASGAESDSNSGAASSREHAHEHVRGFILNDPQAAFRQARASHRLVMIDFFGIWCPPCNELDEHVFTAPGFLKKTRDFVRLKLDVDAPVSWRWKAKYAIQGYPTIIFATPEGEEVGRIVGFRPLETFLADAEGALANRDSSFSKLRAAADSGDHSAAEKLGLMDLDRAQWADAKKYLVLSGETAKYGEQIDEAEIGSLEDTLSSRQKPDPGVTTQLISLLEKSIHDYPDTPDSIDRRMRLAELYKDDSNRKKVLSGAVETARYLMKHPEALQNKDCTAGDLWEEIGEAYQEAGDTTQARQAFQSGVHEYRSLMKSDSERGYSLELAYCLWQSGDVPGAEGVYDKFEKLYPEEFTFFFDHARMDHQLKRDTEALRLAQTAYHHSYGDNRLRTGKLLADILESQGKKDQALAAAKKTLTDVKLPKTASLRAHRYAKQLREMISRLERS